MQADTYHEDGLNLYTGNNPVRYVTPSGHCCKDNGVDETSYGKSSENDSNLEKIINIMKSGEKTPDGKNIISQLDETTKVIFRMDVGDSAHKILSKGYTEPVNHINIEIQKLGQNGSYKPKWDFHIVLDELGEVIDSFPLGVWAK